MKAIWKDGCVVLEGQPDWPEGRQLVVLEVSPSEPTGVGEDDWPNTPEAIADWLKWYDALEPLTVTSEEEADTEAWLKKVNDYSIAQMDKGMEDGF